jgi:hypothetical protein
MDQGRADSIPELLKAKEYVAKRRVVCKEFDLAGTIK